MLLTLLLVLTLGLRHGEDADHLAAIDGFSRLRPSCWNGMPFGLGHGLVVTLLAVFIGQFTHEIDSGWLIPWLFLGVAALNLWRPLRADSVLNHSHTQNAALVASPFLIGLLLAVRMETSSQISSLNLSSSVPPLLLGLTFTLGMILTDSIDGMFASALQRGRQAQPRRAELASRVMGWIVVVLSLGFAVAGFAGWDAKPIAGSLGIATFVALIVLRVWSRLGASGQAMV